DDNGYLPVSPDEVLSCQPGELDIADSGLRWALAQMESLDLAGVGARVLAECLGLQLIRPAPHLEPALLDCARYLVREHVGILASPSQLRQRCAGHYPAELVERAHHLVLKLDPKPGRAWTQNVSAYVVPDVLLIRGKDSWQAA